MRVLHAVEKEFAFPVIKKVHALTVKVRHAKAPRALNAFVVHAEAMEHATLAWATGIPNVIHARGPDGVLVTKKLGVHTARARDVYSITFQGV